MATTKKLNIALIAHDGRKDEMLVWVSHNAHVLSKHNLFATGTTGQFIKKLFNTMNSIDNYSITCMLSGPLGGDQEIGAMIAEGKIDVLIFFCDNLITQGHQQDVSALSRLASLYNIAFASNRTTADMILTSPLFDDANYERIVPIAIENYKNRLDEKITTFSY